MLEKAKEIGQDPVRVGLIAIIAIFVILILIELIPSQPQVVVEEKEQTRMEMLVETYSHNLTIIWDKLEDQAVLRLQIADLEKKLDAKMQEVKNIEDINDGIRDEMIKVANPLQSNTGANEK